ncbi:hypothetical protein FEM48_Zijuj01G0175300 [Ziziphus jujuba var. spinosa]|uniref:Trafficking protein particle complex subunit n=1 Tax=Ziziphus jujuba var. spinosa TaxID=714518 RepID=A0A978W2L5_ZIZJJ|nr:hypothetical protein FEM48_Zijuj01G0175300 [Ziziphus jujuba var. spinosa]
MIGVGKIKQYSNVLDKPLSKGKQEVSLSAFAFLFSELVQYNQTQVDNISELERRLEDAGYAVGARVLELLCHRDKGNRRETRLLGILSFVHSTVWKVLFGKLLPPFTFCYLDFGNFSRDCLQVLEVADSLEKGTEHEDEYMISEKELLVNRFISIPKDMGTFNCGAFVAGIVRGVLDGAGFPAVVTAHFVPVEGQQRPRTTILIKFAEEFFSHRQSKRTIVELASFRNLSTYLLCQIFRILGPICTKKRSKVGLSGFVPRSSDVGVFIAPQNNQRMGENV